MIANKDGGVLPGTSQWASSRRSAQSAAFADDALESALERTTNWLLARQSDEGYWVGELEGDTILESEYVLLMAFLGRESDPVCARCARYIQDHQQTDGGWAIYPGGPTEIARRSRRTSPSNWSERRLMTRRCSCAAGDS